MAYIRALLIIVSCLSFSCAEILGISELRGRDAGVGQDDGGTGPGIDGGASPDIDGGGIDAGLDGGAPPVCGATQCTNCLDDDGDGAIDGEDVHCTLADDDDEWTFISAIPGDNLDPDPADCFYDGNSGSGDDDCQLPQCCLLSTCSGADDCSLSQQCIDFCAPLTPVGCDCFGCCTVCQDGNCRDVLIFPDATPGWDCHDLDNLGDTVACPQCVKAADCSSSCDTGQDPDCVLCPGQRPAELPAECIMQNACPDGRQVCSNNVACPASQYCANGCCIDRLLD
jgi:hypothetical protein